ncbi:MAG: restriction endonuclease subunit S, partial [Desulfobacterales bacterium]
MKRYPAHKNSGVKWLGEVPYEWSVKKLKYIASAIIGLTYSPSELSDETNGVLVLRASNIKDGQLVFEDVVYVNTKISEQLITREGDILVCSRSGSRNLIGKNAIITNSASGCTFGAFMTVIRSKYNYFLYYVFNSILFDFQAGSFLTSTINQLTQSNLNSFKIPLPPEKDQASIIGYLDYKTHRIDKLIKKKQNQVELLKEQRDAIINQAVTKGLDLNVKMKDSGVEWLGEIPEHWEVSKLKYVSIINPSKNTSTATNNSDELVTFLPMERVFEDGTYDNSLKKPTNELWNGFTYFEKNDV